MNNPCKNCTDRDPGCHAHCEKYIGWKKGYLDERKAINDVKYKDYEFMRLVRDRKDKKERDKKNGR